MPEFRKTYVVHGVDADAPVSVTAQFQGQDVQAQVAGCVIELVDEEEGVEHAHTFRLLGEPPCAPGDRIEAVFTVVPQAAAAEQPGD